MNLEPDHDELQNFLREYPHVRFVDALFVDLCGIARGNRMRGLWAGQHVRGILWRRTNNDPAGKPGRREPVSPPQGGWPTPAHGVPCPPAPA